MPELYKEFNTYYGNKPNTWECDAAIIFTGTGNAHSIEFHDWCYLTQRHSARQNYKNSILARFPEVSTLYTRNGIDDDKFLSNTIPQSIDDYIYTSDLLTLDQYALGRYLNYSISDIDVHFLLMFILSNLVRYRQDKWSKLLRRTHSDEMFLIESFMDISSVKFPFIILKELDNIDYRFLGQVATYG